MTGLQGFGEVSAGTATDLLNNCYVVAYRNLTAYGEYFRLHS
jgi:hypothetical protein